MGWIELAYSKGQVDRAGRAFVDGRSKHEVSDALATITNFRSSHSFPLNTFQVGLRRLSTNVTDEVLVAQRVKRLSSIEAKLRRLPRLRLSQMQDIGGCRSVVGSVEAVAGLEECYQRSRMRHPLVSRDDYIAQPRQSGYRGLHLIYRYSSDRMTTYNGLQVELQLRSRLQHAWATAVETAGMFTQQALKSSVGEDEWLRFFALASSAFARIEGTSTVPDTPTRKADLKRELKHLAKQLDVVTRLDAYGEALQALELTAARGKYYVLDLNAAERTLVVHEYRKMEDATQQYFEVEMANALDPGKDAVLVSVDSISALRRAYPNYFADTSVFVKTIQEAIS